MDITEDFTADFTVELLPVASMAADSTVARVDHMVADIAKQSNNKTNK